LEGILKKPCHEKYYLTSVDIRRKGRALRRKEKKMLPKPTCKDILNKEDFESVHREADDSWRHGSYVTEVFRRIVDETYWQVCYHLSTDRETNDLREGTAFIDRVVPQPYTGIKYVRVEEIVDG